MKGLPASLSLLRLALALPLLEALHQGRLTAALTLTALAALTDLGDGLAARRLGVTSRTGAYLDVYADFFFLLAATVALAQSAVYPGWLPVLVALMFAQFVLSSKDTLSYDPLGKYFGAALYTTLLLTLSFPDAALSAWCCSALAVLAFASLLERYVGVRPYPAVCSERSGNRGAADNTRQVD